MDIKQGNMSGIWKEIKHIRKNKIFNGIKELYDNNKNIIIIIGAKTDRY